MAEQAIQSGRVAERRSPTTGNVAAHRLPLWAAALIFLTLPLGAAIVLRDAAPWSLMWAMAFAMYAAAKLVTWADAVFFGPSRPPAGRQLAYLLGWSGLDAPAFLRHPTDTAPQSREWAAAVGKTAFGLTLLALAVRSAAAPVSHNPDEALLIGWLGMLGFIMAAHFGALHVLSCLWRSVNIDARPLMDNPLLSRSVGEFWSRRWNRAFRDLTHRYLFTPLARRFGVAAALWLGFFASGLAHEAVITFPAGAAYGGPTAFFLVQAAAITIERSGCGRRLGLGRDLRGRLFVIVALLAPLPLLFPPVFVHRVVLPWLQAIAGA